MYVLHSSKESVMFNRLPTTLLCWKPLATMDANYRRARVQSPGPLSDPAQK